ncbi:hypothetical protein AB9N12_19245 [Bacteroides sp. AN502(2024)]|uniref:hypothetical protein n=1 Tax=Bacteroides sp. AN502(2024) TaxID=3160599 RepID=UPI0035154ACF
MKRDVELKSENEWQYDNEMNYSFYYWRDVARKVLLGEVCPKIEKSGNTTLALQLANYTTNRIYQLAPLFEAHHYGWDDKEDLDRFLNVRGYVDTDYIYDIVGTLFLREMNYEMAVKWLSKVSKDYQSRTNIAKEGYFKLDPFRYQFDKKHYIADSSGYRLRFAQKMLQLENLMSSDAEVNRKANAKIRYAIGLRNSFGKCWYLTEYGYNLGYESEDDWHWKWFDSSCRDGFKENAFARKAYKKVDALMKQALSEFTDPEQAAQAQFEMMNFKTLMSQYPTSKATAFVRGHCDNYYDYSLQKR